MLSLPWVIERPGMLTAPDLRWFAVDCPILAIRRLWALTGAFDDSGSRCDVHLVLPKPAATLALQLTEAELTDQITPSHCLVTLPAGAGRWPTQQVEQIVRMAYSAALS